MRNRVLFYLVLLVCVGVFFTTQNSLFASETEMEYEGIAYDRYTMEYIGELDDIEIYESGSSINVKFDFNNKLFDLHLDDHQNEENHTLSVQTFSNEKVINDIRTVYNVMKSNKGLFGEIVLPNTSIHQKNNSVEFAYLITDKKIDLKEILNELSNEQGVKERIISNKLSLQTIQSIYNDIIPHSSRTSAYVHATGPSVPLIISSGMAEGWATIQYHPGGSLRTITNLNYNVVYNWPSDGVSLWYDVMDGSPLFHSPAWPPSGVQSVSGSWVVDITKGALAAQATTTAFVKGVPVGYSNYDTDNLR